jgi:pimeloyl-ACP methyl ester carboxylesterase
MNELIAHAQKFVELLATGEFFKAVENFDDVMTKAMPEEKLKQVWQTVLKQAGQFKKQAGVRTEILPKYESVYITCQFEKGPLDVKVVFNREKKITGLWFVPTQKEYTPPDYVELNSFKEKDVVIGQDDWTLPGTLTIPDTKSPFPAVVLVHGSGPNDRDESIGPNKPFRDLAWGLASQKIAVLRYEKRTKVHSQKLMNFKGKFTVKEETVDDALAAVGLLRGIEGIDEQKIFVLGHSLGGMLAPRIGMQDSKIAGLIIMAGTTRPIEEVMLEQVNYIIKPRIPSWRTTRILAGPQPLQSASNSQRISTTHAHASGRTGLSGHRKRFWRMEKGSLLAQRCRIQALPCTQSSLHRGNWRKHTC